MPPLLTVASSCVFPFSQLLRQVSNRRRNASRREGSPPAEFRRLQHRSRLAAHCRRMEQWVMANKPKPSRRDAILDAVLDIVVERGFHDAPISLVSQRSGASPGIIYHYFSGKEEIIQALYERIRAAKIEAIVGDFSPEKDPRDIFLQSCRNVYSFYRKHQREMSFYEQYEHAGFKCIPVA